MTDHEWPELEAAKRKKEEERLEELRRIEADIFTDELEEKLPSVMARKRIRELISKNEIKLKELCSDWNEIVYPLLFKIAEGVWEKYKKKEGPNFGLSSKFVLSENGKYLSLYWEAHRTAFYSSAWLTVELCLNDEYQPLLFKVGCKEPGYILTANVSVDELKKVLLQAFELGAAKDLYRKPKDGIEFIELEKK